MSKIISCDRWDSAAYKVSLTNQKYMHVNRK